MLHVYLIKVTEFCNLNCSYCYMFNLRDFSYRDKDKIMPIEIIEHAAPKMASLAREQNIDSLTISLHGGEPMLAGKEWLRQAVGIINRAGGDKVKFTFAMQTNGVLIDESWLDLFEELKISIGLSMDGPPELHDRHRFDFSGRGSYRSVVKALKLLQDRGDRIRTGVLCVIDPQVNGLEIYKHFRELGIQGMDFLWPLDYNWDNPPPSLHSSDTPYADYLTPIFDAWMNEDDKDVQIRYFEGIVEGLFGQATGLDSLGGNPISIATLDTDGSIEPLDSLRALGDGFTSIGLDIRTDPISALYDNPIFQASLAGQKGLCQTCRACPLHDVCGAGYLPHRYSGRNGFDNPSVYCRDLWKLMTYILSKTVHQVNRAQQGIGDIAGPQPAQTEQHAL